MVKGGKNLKGRPKTKTAKKMETEVYEDDVCLTVPLSAVPFVSLESYDGVVVEVWRQLS